MVKTISGILLNTIKYHYILRQYMYICWGRKRAETQRIAVGPNRLTIAQSIYWLAQHSGKVYRYIQVQCLQLTVVRSRYFLWCEVHGTDDTMWYFKVQVQCWQFTVVLSRYFCACVNNIHVCMIHFQSSLQCPTGELREGKAVYQQMRGIICSALHP